MYTDCKLPAFYFDISYIDISTHRCTWMASICWPSFDWKTHISTHRRTWMAGKGRAPSPRSLSAFQLADVHGLQGYGINPSSCFALRICFRKLHPKDAPSRSTQVRFAQIMVSCWTYFLPGFCRAVPVISASVLLSLGRSKRTRLCCYPIL